MTAGGSADQIELVRIGAEACGVAIDPGHRASTLLDHRKDVAAGLTDIVEIEYHEIGAGLHIGLGVDRELVGAPATPAAAVDEDEHRCVGAAGLVDVELLDLARSVG